MSRQFEGSVVRHGTRSGASLHRERNQDPCPACWEAESAAFKRRLEAPEMQRRGRMRARAQSKAYGRLARLHPADWARLYNEELVKAEAEEVQA